MSTLPPSPSPRTPASQVTDPPSCPAIAFQIAGQWLAIPYTALLRVVHSSALSQNVRSETLAYLGKQPLAMLNLHALLAEAHRDRQNAQQHHAAIEPQSNSPFLVIAALETTLVGIPVNQLPVLLDLPLAATHALPANYYNAIQGVASHVVTVPQLGAVLLLNLHAATNGALAKEWKLKNIEFGRLG